MPHQSHQGRLTALVPMVTNIADYKFAPLVGLADLRSSLLDFCRQRGLKGTILLAPEGINLCVAGEAPSIQALLERLKQIAGLSDLAPKFSTSEIQPFSRMLVRLKKEIIAFGVASVDPTEQPAPRLPARTLKQWLDEKRPLVLLDTRNQYEVKLGTFSSAVPIGIDHFRDFPEAAQGLPAAMKEAAVVTFCTGGIRCEKAAPLLQQLGFAQVWQLDGGILRYFEEVGGDHFEGECFVFDRRVGLDPALSETASLVCSVCLAPVTVAEQTDPKYRLGVSCPACWRDPLERRQQALRSLTRPLPGSLKGENRRPLRIPGRLDSLPLGQALAQLFPHLAPSYWQEVSAAGLLLAPGGRPACLEASVRAGQEYTRITLEEVEPEVNADIRLLYEDQALLVLDKPAPLPMHPCGRFQRNTLRHFLQLAWHPQSPRPAHRLDANTTGVVVCARTHHFSRLIQPLFARGQVEKKYLARVHGHPSADTFTVDLPIAAEPGAAGIRQVGEGLQAVTVFRVLARLPQGISVLEAQPVTGRTNQIRAHLWHCGHPIVGDPAYLRGGQLGQRQTLTVAEAPLQLHCWSVSLPHPVSGEKICFSTPAPFWKG